MGQGDAFQRKRIGAYRVVRKLGRGAMGIVWLGHDPGLRRDVAIKMLPGELAEDSRSLARFTREARLAAKLHHTNVVAVYEIGRHNGDLFIAMEAVDGRSLKDEMREKGRLDWRDATRVIRDACAGLSAAHQIGLVHRDVKPSNLLRTSSGITKVADFGLARAGAATTSLTQPGMTVGTPAYMAPEQCRGEEADARSDLYSLACTYYALACGRPPFQGAEESPSPPLILYRHVHDPFPDPRALVSDLPDQVCRIITRGAQKEPDGRYQCAEEMLADLDAVLSGQDAQLTYGAGWGRMAPAHSGATAVARPAGLVRALTSTVIVRTAKLIEKRPVALAVGACVFVAVLVGVASVRDGRAPLSRTAELPELTPEELKAGAPAGLEGVVEQLQEDREVTAAQAKIIQGHAQAAACRENLKMLGHGILLYAFDHDERCPAGDSWCDDLKEYVGGSQKVFQCPALPDARSAYGLNKDLAGTSFRRVQYPAVTVLLFEIDGGWNASGGRERMIKQPRHPGGYNIAFVDGHTEQVSADELGALTWTP